MFGNLFNEDSPLQGSVEASLSVSIPSPPRPRSENGFAGIDNQGATCYLNSLLQTLLLTPEFREKLFSLTDRDLGKLQDRDLPNAKVRVIPIQLQRLFAFLLLSDQESVSTADLTNSFGWTNNEEFQQHDVQELNRILFSAIEESLIGTAGDHIINELYHGTIVNQIKCSKCKKISEREEDFLDLTLAVAGASGLEGALKQCYCDVEMMDGRNQYRCERCETYTDATKGAKLRNLPPILSLSLLRFSYDFVKMSRYKENGRFPFPVELDMSPYSEKDTSTSDYQYELFSVVVHRGGAYGGHYFAYIRDIDSLGYWVPPDDTTSNKVDPKTTGLDIIECQSPVDLIENILGQASHMSMSVDRLCAEISKVTGVSWNKRFKKTHGPINKFLKSCESFDYNQDANWVSLSALGQAAVQNDKEKPVKTEEGSVDAEPENRSESMSSKRTSTPNPNPGCHWFSFNDSRVAPIHAKEIERQFSGKESAYMLFYRCKSLQRPIEAKGQSCFGVPQSLIDDVKELNISLEKQRQEYEIAINNVKLMVYRADDFTFDGLLHLKHPQTEPCVIDIDKRKPLSELKEKIQELVPEMTHFFIHEIKGRCGGFHLYDEVKDFSLPIQSTALSKETSLFVWNGATIENQFVDTGADCEPIKLTVRDQCGENFVEIVLAKSKSLSDLHSAIAHATNTDVSTMNLLLLSEDGTKIVKELNSPLIGSLVTFGVKDGDVLMVVDSENTKGLIQMDGDLNTADKCEIMIEEVNNGVEIPLWSLTLQDRLKENNTHHTCKTVDILVQSTMSVKDLKIKALNTLEIFDNSLETVRLREDHRTMGLQPPLREGLTLADCGLSNKAVVVIESGRPPQDSEMTISVNKIDSGKLVSKREFLVDRKLTVLGMLQAACRLMECSGTQWYLSKTDVYGDPAETLDDTSATLLDLLINDGDTLILQQGPVIRKDQVCLNMWIAPSLPQTLPDKFGSGDNVTSGNPALRQEEEDKIMLELAAKLSINEHIPTKDLNPLNSSIFPDIKQLFENSLVISKTMPVEELKQALMSTEQFQTLRIPTANFMRVRIVEGMRLKGILRNSSQTLRHANTKDALNLAVQILPVEESLGVHEILLMVAQKIGGTRIYMPAKEFVWNTSAGVTAGDLRRAISAKYSLTIHDVLLAKYNPDTCLWTVLRDVPPKSAKHKGKKKSGGGKCNIRHAPYNVQEGDLIGVKIISADKETFDTEDFSTQEDIEKRQLLQQLAEEKKRMREQKKLLQDSDGLPSQRRPEVALTIKVDKFS